MEQGTASCLLAESVQRIDSFIPSTTSETNKLVDESTLSANLGELSELKTTEKTNLVGAINEIRQSGDVYSTKEIIVGTWIDGKPIYRKVLSMNISVSSNSLVNTNIAINDIKTIVNANAIGYDNSYPNSTVSGIHYAGYDSNRKIMIIVHYSGRGNNLILEYTKTTD